MADDVNIRFGASIEELKSKLGEVVSLLKGVGDGATSELKGRATDAFGAFGSGAQTMAKNVVDAVDNLPPVFKSIGLAVVGVGAIIAAGIGAKKLADENAEMIESTRDFARAMGITTNEASVYRAALEDVGSSQGEFEGASRGLARQMKTNEEGLKKLGLETKNEAGEKKSSAQLTMEAIAILGTYREGQDRAAVSQVLFGRGLSASSRLLLMNKDDLEAVRKEVERLGLEVGEKATDGYKEFDAAADQATRVQQAFAKQIQEAVIPVAVELTEWFNNIGPDAIAVFRVAVGTLTSVFLGLTNGVRIVWETINAFVISIAEPLRAVSSAIYKLLTGDFAGAGSELAGISKVVVGAWETAFNKIAESSEKTGARMDRAMGLGGPDKKPGDKGGPTGDKTAPDFAGDKQREKEAEAARKKAEAEAKRSAKEAEREREKAAEAMFKVEQAAGQVTLNIQKETLKEEAAANEDAFKNNLISLDAYYDEKLRIELAGINASRNAKLAELGNANDKVAGADKESERLKFAAEAIKLQGEIVVLTRQEGEAVRANGEARTTAERQLANQLAGIRAGSAKEAAEAELDEYRAGIEQQRALGLIDNEQALAQHLNLEQRQFAITKQFLDAKRALLQPGDQGGQAAAQAEEEAAYRQHTQRMGDIGRQMQLERARDSLQAQGAIQGSFATMVNSVLSGTQSIGNAMRDFGRSVANVFTNLIAQRFTQRLFDAAGVNTLIDKMVSFVTEGGFKMVASWIAAQLGMTGAAAAGTAARQGIEQAASAQSIATWAMTALKNIAASAWEAAARVYANVAAIPYVGWILAPALAVAAGAAVIGFGSRIMSSAGGDVRVDQDRLNLVHKDETIIPARFAGGLRDLISGGGPAIGVGGSAIPTSLPSGIFGRAPSAGITPGGGGDVAASRGRGGGSGPPVVLAGASAGQFFIANRKDLLKVLSDSGRDRRG